MPIPPNTPPARPAFPVDDTDLEGKALIASRSPWGVLAAFIVGFVITKFGFHADDQTVAIISGICVLAGGYLVRLVTHKPITGVMQAGHKPIVREYPVAAMFHRR